MIFCVLVLGGMAGDRAQGLEPTYSVSCTHDSLRVSFVVLTSKTYKKE